MVVVVVEAWFEAPVVAALVMVVVVETWFEVAVVVALVVEVVFGLLYFLGLGCSVASTELVLLLMFLQ